VNFYEQFERYVKRPCKRAALFIGALFGEPGEGLFAGTFERRKKNLIWVPFLGPRGQILGAIWNFSKGTGLP